MGYGEAKQTLLDTITNYRLPMYEQKLKLERNPDYIKDILKQGAKKAEIQANSVLNRVKDKIGLNLY